MRQLSVGISFFLALFCCSSATAYILPSKFILETWVKKHSGLKNIRIKTLVTAQEGEKPGSAHFKELTVYNVEKTHLKSWALDDSDRKLYAIEKSDDKIATAFRLLVSSDLKTLARVLKDKGIPIRLDDELLSLRTETERRKAESEFLDRWNGAPAWVIGQSEMAKEIAPSLWFLKDAFTPLRFLFISSTDNELYDVRYDGIRYYKGYPYPKVIDVAKKGKGIIFSIQLIEIEVNSESNIRTNSSEKIIPGFTDQESSISSSVKDLIRLYYDIIR